MNPLSENNKNHNDLELQPNEQQPLTGSSDTTLPADNPNDHRQLADSKRQTMGTLELLEERAVVDKERLDVGKIRVRKHTKTKTVNIPVELVEEVLVVETDYYDADSRRFLNTDATEEDLVRLIEPTLNSKPSIKVNGTEVFLDQEPVEIVLSRQVAVVKKETHAVQDVAIEKSTHIHKDTFEVELKHEELEVSEEGNINIQSNQPLDK